MAFVGTLQTRTTRIHIGKIKIQKITYVEMQPYGLGVTRGLVYDALLGCRQSDESAECNGVQST